MKASKFERKINKKAIKKIQKLIEISPLNPFVLFHYVSLKECELNNNKESIASLINYNKRIISRLKCEIKDRKICDIHKEIVKNYVEELECSNRTSKEIIRIINLRKREFYHKRLQQKYNKSFTKSSRPSETN